MAQNFGKRAAKPPVFLFSKIRNFYRIKKFFSLWD